MHLLRISQYPYLEVDKSSTADVLDQLIRECPNHRPAYVSRSIVALLRTHSVFPPCGAAPKRARLQLTTSAFGLGPTADRLPRNLPGH